MIPTIKLTTTIEIMVMRNRFQKDMFTSISQRGQVFILDIFNSFQSLRFFFLVFVKNEDLTPICMLLYVVFLFLQPNGKRSLLLTLTKNL